MILLAWITYANLSTHLFDNDDHGYIELMEKAQKDVSILFDINRQVAMRPPVDLLAYISYFFFKANPEPYHILLVFMQLLVSLLLAYTFRQMGANLETSLLGGLLFLMNVSHFRVIQWITCRSYVLTLFFGLGLLIHYHNYLQKKQKRSLYFASLFLILAIFTHPATITFALFCLYLSWQQQKGIRPALLLSGPLLALALICVMLAFIISTHSDQVKHIEVAINIPEMIRYFLWDISRLLTNAHWLLADFKDYPDTWELGIGILFCLIIGFLLYFKIYPSANWGIWIIVTLLPFIYFPHMLTVGPSRHIYFSSVGSSFILAQGVFWVAQKAGQIKKIWGQIIFIFLTSVLIGSSFIALKRTEAIAFYTAGRSYISIGNLPEGIRQLERAYIHDPALVPIDGYLRLAAASFAFGKPQTAIFEEGLKRYPNHLQLLMLLGLSHYFSDDAEKVEQGREMVQLAFEKTTNKENFQTDAGIAFQNLAAYYHKNKNYEKAVNLYQEALMYRPNYSIALFNLANALYEQGQKEKSIETMRQLLSIDPKHKSALRNLGNMLFEQAQYLDATTIYQQYLNLYDQDPDIYYNLGLSFQKLDRLDEAARIYEEVLKDMPTFTDAHINLGILNFSQQKYKEAIGNFSKATELSPNDFEAYLGLAQAYQKTRQIQQAIKAYQRVLTIDPQNQIAQTELKALNGL